MASATWICVECGARQTEAGRCSRCQAELLDGRLANVRELMADIDLRAALKRESRNRMIAVAVGILPVILLWMVPGYWATRRELFAVPMLADQWALMIGIALVATKGLERYAGVAKRFPYLDDNQQLT
ncbi:MAG TPA: hypothetical protein PLF40_04805 [Kofleriaceae bacterium]|nr:hypothetical protein [Kofleriaceae bacterium]